MGHENMRRVKCLMISHDQLLRIIQGKLCVTPGTMCLPTDAQVVGIYEDWPRNSFGVVIYSESFEENPIGVMMPTIEYTVRPV